MKTYLRSIAFLFVTALLTSCATCPICAPKGKVEHIVLAWLKKPGNAADRAKIVAAAKDLKAGIPQVKALSVGQVLLSERPIVDDSFDVALVMRFNSKEDMQAYEKHPVHVKAVKEVLQPLTSKVVVYDFVTE
ncbi:MAG: Dabb family protein [Verrucomicrobiaceae bacterium]|nr:Dabb family protein [Verrucomicrobiaceae bacterium]